MAGIFSASAMAAEIRDDRQPTPEKWPSRELRCSPFCQSFSRPSFMQSSQPYRDETRRTVLALAWSLAHVLFELFSLSEMPYQTGGRQHQHQAPPKIHPNQCDRGAAKSRIDRQRVSEPTRFFSFSRPFLFFAVGLACSFFITCWRKYPTCGPTRQNTLSWVHRNLDFVQHRNGQQIQISVGKSEQWGKCSKHKTP